MLTSHLSAQPSLPGHDSAYAVYADEMTYHAWTRMGERGISRQDIDRVMSFGRLVQHRGAEIYAIGKREVAYWRKANIDLTDLEGVQIVCSHEDASIITLYRNRELTSIRTRFRRFAPKQARQQAALKQMIFKRLKGHS